MKNPPVSGRIPCLGSVRKRDFDAAARAVVGAYADCAPEPCDDQAAEVQADARPGFERIYLSEAVEHPFLLVRGDAYAGIGHEDMEPTFTVVLFAADRDGTRCGEFGGVLQQVVDYARHVGFIGRDDAGAATPSLEDVLYRRVLGKFTLDLQPLGTQQAEIGFGERQGLFGADEPRQFEHVLQQGGQRGRAGPYLFAEFAPRIVVVVAFEQ